MANRVLILVLQTGRPVLASRGGISTAAARPLTAVRGAGYTSSKTAAPQQVYDPLNQASRGAAAPLSDNKATDQ